MLTNPETGSDEAPTRKIVDFQLTFVISFTWSVVSTKLVIESIPGMVLDLATYTEFCIGSARLGNELQLVRALTNRKWN